MPPQLHYARTADGVNIAYFSLGRGPAVVFGSNVWGDANFYSVPHPHTRRMTDALVALGWRVIRYDLRGAGSSQRDAADLGTEARILDLEAVIDHAGLGKFAVAGVDTGAMVAMSYAARHPDKVSRIVAINGWAHLSDHIKEQPAYRTVLGMASLAETDWDFYTLTIAKIATSLDDPEHTRRLAETLRRSSSPAAALATHKTRMTADIRPLLPLLTMPVLVIHDTGFPFGALSMCQELVAGLPDGRLVIVEGDGAAEIEAIDSFLREGEEPAPTAVTHAGASVLTPRESEVLRLIAAGRTNSEISADLVLSVRTVARHITNIYAKIGARGKSEATAYAIRNGLG